MKDMNVVKRSQDTGTRFTLISGNDLRDYKIVQIVVPQIYENNLGYAVFLCEVESEE